MGEINHELQHYQEQSIQGDGFSIRNTIYIESLHSGMVLTVDEESRMVRLMCQLNYSGWSK